MIKSLVSQGPYLVINGGYHNYPYMSPGAVCAGQLRWNTNTNEMEVNDGVSWRSLNANNTSIALTTEAQDALSWAMTKMQQERELNARMQRHPGLRDTWEKFKIMEALCQEEDARQLNS
jgi:hypothetical protein